MSLDYNQYPSSEITDPMREDPCYPPLLQLTDSPSPELFDQECDNDDEVSEFCCSPEKMDAFFASFRDTNPDISTNISTLSAFTNSTDSSYEIASSQYSFNVTSSDYSNPSEFETHGSVNSPLSSMQAFIPTAELTNHLPYIPPLNPAEAHGTMDIKSNFFPDCYPITVQQSESVTCVNPADLAVHMSSDSEAQAAPVKKPFKCPLCPFSSARRHNLKTHIETHNKEAPKQFGCSTCGRRLTRKHDLRRHCHTIHGDQMPSSSSSPSNFSSRRFDLRPDPPHNRTTTVSGDEQLMSSPHPGPVSATVIEDLTARMKRATWFQGEVP